MDNSNQKNVVDVTPSPRILRALGEIPFEPWQCFAELIDNSFDAFASSTMKKQDLKQKRVVVSWSSEWTLPLDRTIEIRDTGLGMSIESIQDCVRAGYTSNTPIGSLGLFGMGFNIATARLGEKATFLSTRPGDTSWVGVEIDFDEIGKHNSFVAPVISSPKTDVNDHGTRVIISKLKPGIYDVLKRTESKIRATLEDIYSPVLLADSSIELLVNKIRCKPQPYCIWSEIRYVVRSGEKVPAVIKIDQTIGTALFDITKNRYLSIEEESSAQEYKNAEGCWPAEIVERKKRIHGWLGVQRFADSTSYGIDFVRNGRKILRKDKSLFRYFMDLVGAEKIEYPIELGTQGGRIVGEIHVDHLVPTYQKNDFDRADKSWFEVVQELRGDGPLLPGDRKSLGMDGPNASPIGKLVSAYRRTDAGTQCLAVPNSTAKEWRQKFFKGEVEYLSDDKWWAAAQQADQDKAEKKGSQASPVDVGDQPSDDPSQYLGNRTGSSGNNQPTSVVITTGRPPATHVSPQINPLDKITEKTVEDVVLSREYRCKYAVHPIKVDVRNTMSGMRLPGPEGDEAFLWDARQASKLTFYYDLNHLFFRETRIQPNEILLMYIAEQFKARDRLSQTLPQIFSDLFAKMFPEQRVNPFAIQERAKDFFAHFRDASIQRLDSRESEVLDLIHQNAGILEDTLTSLLSRPDLQDLLQKRAPGGIAALIGVPERMLVALVDAFPEEFFDQNYFQSNYMGISLPSQEATERIRQETKDRIIGFMKDALWAISPRSHGSKDELLRCAHSIDLLAEEVVN